MRACFMGQNVTALGFGVAILHTPRLPDPETPMGEKPVPPDDLSLPGQGEKSPIQRTPEPA